MSQFPICKTSKAVTLTELIVTSVIVSFVMIGIFGADAALRSMDKNISADARTVMQTKALAEAIRMSARRLHDTPSISSGFWQVGTSFCFRQDAKVSEAYTPSVYTDDTWDCYTQSGVNVYRCASLAAAGTCSASTGIFVGTLVSDQFSAGASIIPLPKMTSDAVTGEYYFSWTLVNRLDPSEGAAKDGSTLTAGTVDNPQVIIRIKENAAGF